MTDRHDPVERDAIGRDVDHVLVAQTRTAGQSSIIAPTITGQSRTIHQLFLEVTPTTGAGLSAFELTNGTALTGDIATADTAVMVLPWSPVPWVRSTSGTGLRLVNNDAANSVFNIGGVVSDL